MADSKENTPKTIDETRQIFQENHLEIMERQDSAIAVLDSANEELKNAQQNNLDNPNTGLNTNVAKDSDGNVIGTYDWDKQAENTAKISYNSDVLSERQKAITQRQELVSNQQEGQVQHDMAGYSAAQSAEKAGWTGGYILDSNRQVAFLKESIKANLYSQEELQKRSFDNALAAARANYDLKKSELAMQYYNDSVTQSLQLADLTGVFISPEASFHISQRGTADAILNDSGASSEEKARAEEVKQAVDKWFESNKISDKGVYVLSRFYEAVSAAQAGVTSIANALTANTDAWKEFEARVSSNEEAVSTWNNEQAYNSNQFKYIDSYGVVKTVDANFAQAAASGNTPKDIPSSYIAQYNSLLGKYVTDITASTVKGDMLNKNFTSAGDAEKWAEYFLSNALTNINADVTIGTFNVSCKINGEDATIEITGDKVSNCKKTVEKPEGGLVTDTTPSENRNEDNQIVETDTGEAISITADTFADYNKAIDGSVGSLKSGENFHIARTAKEHGESDNWDLELQEDLSTSFTKYKEELKIPDGYVGVWYCNTNEKGPCFYVSGTSLFVIGAQYGKSDKYEKFERAMASRVNALGLLEKEKEA